MRNNRDLPLPSYRSTGASGLDLCAAVENDEFLEPGQLLPVPCGFAIALPPGFEAQIRPEWNLAKKSGVTVLNSPGTIDSDFRGEIEVLLINLGRHSVRIKRGMRIAKIIIKEVPRIKLKEVKKLPPSIRATGGFGHTGR